MNAPRILIVEDELIARENLDHVLKKEGYETVAADSGMQAFKELEKVEFDLVMTDLRMQQVDGLQVLERTGLQLQGEFLLRALADAGCRVDFNARRAWFTPDLVERQLAREHEELVARPQIRLDGAGRRADGGLRYSLDRKQTRS